MTQVRFVALSLLVLGVVGMSGAARRCRAAQLLPDLIAWEDETKNYIHGWVTDVEEIPGRVLLRFTTASANIGAGALQTWGEAEFNADGTQNIYQRITDLDAPGGFVDQFIGAFSPDHRGGYIHIDHYADYFLREVTEGDGVGEIVGVGQKVSHCMVDSVVYDTSLPGAPIFPTYRVCSVPAGGAATHGISVGRADIYSHGLEMQWVDVTGVAGGTYWLELTLDPDNVIVESNDDNNTSRIMIDYTAVEPLLPGDANGDGAVDRRDAAIVVQNLGFAHVDAFRRGDFDNDDQVTLIDLAIFQANRTPAASTPPLAVPEPSTLALAGIAVLGMLLSRRKSPQERGTGVSGLWGKGGRGRLVCEWPIVEAKRRGFASRRRPDADG